MENKRDEDLMLEYREGNKEALSMIFERYKTYVLNYALRILGNRADAEDTVSEVFITVFNQRYRFDPRAKFSTWLFTVTRNMCISKLRQKKHVVSLWFKNEATDELQEWDVPDSNPLPSENLHKAETFKYIRNAINKLPLPQKEALVLREYHGLSYEEISKVLDCSLDNVKVLIFRARVCLRKEIPSFLKEEHYG